jgi:hypothetical protein
LQLTKDQAVVALVQLIPNSSEQDVRAFLACSDAERSLIIQSLKDAQIMPGPSAWDRVLGILRACADLAGLVLPIEGAIVSTYGLTRL